MLRQTKITAIATGLLTTAAFGGAHTWDVNEVFSNHDGTIQFVELREANGTPNEVNVGGRPVSSDSTGNQFTIASAVASPTTNKHLLFATAAFAALPGAPTPDQIIPAGLVPFFNINGDTVRYNPYDAFTFGAVPIDGVNSMNDGGIIAANSPTNYAGVTGSVDAGPPPVPGDFDGDGDVDADDFEHYADCLDGPDATPTPDLPDATDADCIQAFDQDDDNDVDLADFASFQAAFTG
ncbi:MAG TPA: hypothetical protein PKN33_11015 [Phycisphaerae bacterium]|nr:hypothetical protein [Phycisphaerae bacterium]